MELGMMIYQELGTPDQQPSNWFPFVAWRLGIPDLMETANKSNTNELGAPKTSKSDAGGDPKPYSKI